MEGVGSYRPSRVGIVMAGHPPFATGAMALSKVATNSAALIPGVPLLRCYVSSELICTRQHKFIVERNLERTLRGAPTSVMGGSVHPINVLA